MELHIEVSQQRIEDLLEGHGGSMSPWLNEITNKGSKSKPLYRVKFDREEDEEGGTTGLLLVNTNKIKEGLECMASINPYQFSQWLNCDDDDVTFDVAWQCIIFGKLVYA